MVLLLYCGPVPNSSGDKRGEPAAHRHRAAALSLLTTSVDVIKYPLTTMSGRKPSGEGFATRLAGLRQGAVHLNGLWPHAAGPKSSEEVVRSRKKRAVLGRSASIV